MKKYLGLSIFAGFLVFPSCDSDVINSFVLADFSNQWTVVKGDGNIGNRMFFLTSNIDSVKFTGDIDVNEQGDGISQRQLVGKFIKDDIDLRYLKNSEVSGGDNGPLADRKYKGVLDRRNPNLYYIRLKNIANAEDSLVVRQGN
ncbi:MAG: hypothetical protein ACXWV5_08895 [Flavitalea sp.]